MTATILPLPAPADADQPTTPRAPRLLSRHRRRTPASATPQGQLAHERYLRDVRQVARLLAWHGLNEKAAASIVRVYKPSDRPQTEWGTAYPRLCAWFAAGLVTDVAEDIRLGEAVIDALRIHHIFEPCDLAEFFSLGTIQAYRAEGAASLTAKAEAARVRAREAWLAKCRPLARPKVERPIVDLAEALKVRQ